MPRLSLSATAAGLVAVASWFAMESTLLDVVDYWNYGWTWVSIAAQCGAVSSFRRSTLWEMKRTEWQR